MNRPPRIPLWRGWLLLLVVAWVVFAPSVLVALPRAGSSEIPAAAPCGRMDNYLYAQGNPVMFSDPSGNFSIVEIATTLAVVSTVAIVAYPTVRPVVANVVGFFSGAGPNARYSLSSIGVYDENAALLASLGLSADDFGGNLFQDAFTELGTDLVVGAVSAGAAAGVAKGFSAFRRANPDPTPQFTKSSLRRGRAMHDAYKSDLVNPALGRFKEFRLNSGRRIDFLDVPNRKIYELKPNNPRQIAAGEKQLQDYLKELQADPKGAKGVMLYYLPKPGRCRLWD